MLGVQAWGQTTTPQRTNPAPSGSQIPNCHLEVGNPRFVLGVRKVRGVRHSFAFTARRCGSRDCELHEEPCAELTAHTAGSSFPLGFAPPVCSRDRLPTPANRPRRLQGAPYRGGLLDPHPAGSALLCGFSPNFAMGQQSGGAVAGPEDHDTAANQVDGLRQSRRRRRRHNPSPRAARVSENAERELMDPTRQPHPELAPDLESLTLLPTLPAVPPLTPVREPA